MASLFCCKYRFKHHQHPGPDAPAPPDEPRSQPRIHRRQTIPKPAASKKEIEKFYREGKELRRTEEEEQERATLRASKKDLGNHEQGNEEDIVVEDPNERPPSVPSKSGTQRTRSTDINIADSEEVDSGNGTETNYYLGPPTAGSSRFSFETTTDRNGVRNKEHYRSSLTFDPGVHEEARPDTVDKTEVSGDVGRPHSRLSTELDNSPKPERLERFSTARSKAQTFWESAASNADDRSVKATFLGDVDLPEVDFSGKHSGDKKGSIPTPIAPKRIAGTLPTIPSKDSGIVPLKKLPFKDIGSSHSILITGDPRAADHQKSSDNHESEHIAFTETTTHQPSRKDSDITVTNIFSRIPSLLKPSVSTFSLDTFVGYSTGSPRTTSPSPPPRLSSMGDPRPAFSVTESITSFSDSDFTSRPITPRLAHLQSSSSIYPSLANSVYSVDEETNSRIGLSRHSNDLSRNFLSDNFSGELVRPGQHDTELWEENGSSLSSKYGTTSSYDNKSPSSTDNRQEKYKNHKLSGTKGVGYGSGHSKGGYLESTQSKSDATNHEKATRESDTGGFHLSLDRTNTVIHRPDYRQIMSSAMGNSAAHSTRNKDSDHSRDGLSASGTEPMLRSVSRGLDRPSNLRHVQTRTDTDDERLDQASQADNQQLKLSRSRSQKFLKPLASGISKMREAVGFTSSARSSSSVHTHEEASEEQSGNPGLDSTIPDSPSRQHNGSKRLPITVAVFDSDGDSPGHRISTMAVSSSHSVNDSTRLGPDSTRRSDSRGHRSVVSIPTHNISRNSTVSSIFRTQRNTTYDDCVIFPFNKDGADDEDIYSDESKDDKRYNASRPETPYLSLDEDVVSQKGEEDGGLLKELGKSSLNWRNVQANVINDRLKTGHDQQPMKEGTMSGKGKI
ncbi:hypothetical protein EX30DRAFT_338263 [Ascodesmis nigricans]|uniref:Uncharacterized protein n=1 Tax=Ascodesmis nigricans TaxID=341454 RepID=A0A4S2N3M6_9PEZI|nr:hypothetical protein EX30DRAFT_338263 [Ascodesmis nigricans]